MFCLSSDEQKPWKQIPISNRKQLSYLMVIITSSTDRRAWQATVHGVAEESDMPQQLNNKQTTTDQLTVVIYLQNYNSLLNNRQKENVGSHQKKITHVQGQRRTPVRWQEVRNCIQNQTPYLPEMLGGLKQTLSAPGPRDSTETEPELCLTVSCSGRGCSGLLQGQGLWVQQNWVWHKPSWRRSPITPS